MRGDGDDLLLVVVNFNDIDSVVKVHIPDDAYSFFQIKKKIVGHASALLNSISSVVNFSDTEPLRLEVDAYSGEIFKITFE